MALFLSLQIFWQFFFKILQNFLIFACMLVKIEAIVLKNTILGDQKMIVDLFTDKLGCVSVITHFSSSVKGKLKKQLFVPLSILDVEIDYKENSSLQKLKNATINTPYTDIPFDSYKLSISFFISEVTFFAVRGENENKPLFDFITNSLMWLDAKTSSCPNFHLVYMMGLVSYLGFMPNLDDYHDGDLFDLRNACFDSCQNGHTDYLNAEESAKLVSLARMNYSTMHVFKMSHNDRNRIVEVLLTFYRLHIPGFPEIKSLDILKQLFS